jgi:uncharacterized protein (DUF885 family)
MLAAGSTQAADATQKLHALFDESWERKLREDPIAASKLGDHRSDARWPDYSAAALAKQAEADRAALVAVDAIPESELSASDRLNRDLFRRLYADRVASYEFGAQYLALHHQNESGVQVLDELAELLPFATVQDYESWIARLESIGTPIDQLERNVLHWQRQELK